MGHKYYTKFWNSHHKVFNNIWARIIHWLINIYQDKDVTSTGPSSRVGPIYCTVSPSEEFIAKASNLLPIAACEREEQKNNKQRIIFTTAFEPDLPTPLYSDNENTVQR